MKKNKLIALILVICSFVALITAMIVYFAVKSKAVGSLLLTIGLAFICVAALFYNKG